MNKLLKILLWTVASLVILILLAAILLPLIIDPNDYKDEIAAQVYNQTGRELKIDGDIDLSFSFPLSVALDLGQVELSNAPGFGDQPFAKMQNASLFVSVWPLITQNHLTIGEVKLTGMELNLIKNEQGKTNWEDLSKADDAQAIPADVAKSTTISAQTGSTSPVITIDGVTIKDANINWSDRQSQQQLNLSHADINISQLTEDKPFDLEISTHLTSTAPSVTGNIRLISKPTLSLSRQLYRLQETELSLDLTGAALPGQKNKTMLVGDIVFDGQKQQLDVTNMKLSTYDMLMHGLLSVAADDKGVHYNGKMSIDPFSPKILAAHLGSKLPELENPKAMDSSSMQFEFNGNQNQLTISALDARLDDTSLTGTAVIKSFNPARYGFELALNQLDLDYYASATANEVAVTPPPATSKGGAETAPQAQTGASSKTGSPDNLFPLDTLRQLNLDGKLSIGKFKAGGAKMTNVVIILKGNQGIIQLAPLKADLYNGKMNLNTSLNATKKTPTLKLSNDLSHVNLGELLMDTTGSSEFTGKANINADIETAGNTQEQLLKNSNGTARLLISDGRIKSLDIITTLRAAQALYRGQIPPTQAQQENTKFTELTGTFNIKQGVVHNNDLYSRSPVMEFTGKGYADLPREYMDYTLNVKMLNSLKIDDQNGGTDYKGQEFPYTIKGKFSDLSQTAGVDKVLEQHAKKAIEKKINKEIERQFGDKFKDLIKF